MPRFWRARLGTFRQTQGLLAEDVRRFMKRSPDGVLLLHIDEHGKMCEDVEFRKGAMAVMASLPQVRLVATFTDIIPQPAVGSETCRSPVAKLCLDVKTVTERLPRLKVLMAETADERRLLASLRVSLGLALSNLGLAGLHVKDERLEAFLDRFECLAKTGDKNEVYRKCIQHCSEQWMQKGPRECKHLVDLFCGIEESDERVQEQRYPAVVSLEDTLTAPLEVLLRDADPDDPARLLYNHCRSLFKKSLGITDWASGSVLERAYLWALACKFTRRTPTPFGDFECQFVCEQVAAARIFKGRTLMPDNVQALKKNTLYCANEQKKSHPFADMWFLSPDNVLFLLEVGGTSGMDEACKKVTMLKIVLEEQDFNSLNIDGVVAIVLFPNIMDKLSSDKDVLAITGSQAQKLLGGLVQVLDWL